MLLAHGESGTNRCDQLKTVQRLVNKLNRQNEPDEPMVNHTRLKGYFGPQRVDWFAGVALPLEANGETLVTWPVGDGAALHGLLRRVRDGGMPLLSVTRIEAGKQGPGASNSDVSQTAWTWTNHHINHHMW